MPSIMTSMGADALVALRGDDRNPWMPSAERILKHVCKSTATSSLEAVSRTFSVTKPRAKANSQLVLPRCSFDYDTALSPAVLVMELAVTTFLVESAVGVRNGTGNGLLARDV